jgi:hypothetical protein
MLRHTAVLTACVLFAGVQASAASSFYDGNQLYALCTDTNRASAALTEGMCRGYVMGVVDQAAGQALYGQHICLPNGVSAVQATDVVVRYLRENPAERHIGAGTLAAKALGIGFPCSAR